MEGRLKALWGFGVFGVKAVPERQRRNPRTGAPVWLAVRHRPFFKAAKKMHARLNGGKGQLLEPQEHSSPPVPMDD
jgi:nucleoid DNA-binding protein